MRTADKDTLCAMAVHAAAADGADVNTRPEAAAGEEPEERWLTLKAKEGLEETVRALVEAGAEVNLATNKEWTALYGAAQEGHSEVVRALAVAAAEVNHTDDEGRTAMYGAAFSGHVDAGADAAGGGGGGESPEQRGVHCALRSSAERSRRGHEGAAGVGRGGEPRQ